MKYTHMWFTLLKQQLNFKYLFVVLVTFYQYFHSFLQLPGKIIKTTWKEENLLLFK